MQSGRIRKPCCGVSVHISTDKGCADVFEQVLTRCLAVSCGDMMVSLALSVYLSRSLSPSLTIQIVLAISRFRQDYGTKFDGQYVIPAIWQLALGGGSLLGLLLGGVGAGLIAKKWGRQSCMGLSYGKFHTSLLLSYQMLISFQYSRLLESSSNGSPRPEICQCCSAARYSLASLSESSSPLHRHIAQRSHRCLSVVP